MLVKAFTSLDRKLDIKHVIDFKGQCKKCVNDYLSDWLNRSQNPEASVKMAIEYNHATGMIFCWNYINDYNNHPSEDISEEAI